MKKIYFLAVLLAVSLLAVSLVESATIKANAFNNKMPSCGCSKGYFNWIRVGSETGGEDIKVLSKHAKILVETNDSVGDGFASIQTRNVEFDNIELVQYGRNGHGNYFDENSNGAAILGGDPYTYLGIGTRTNTPIKFATNSRTWMTLRTDGVLEGLKINSKTPTSASDSCKEGEIVWDSDYIYICIADNTWKRSQLSAW